MEWRTVEAEEISSLAFILHLSVLIDYFLFGLLRMGLLR